MAQKRKYWRMFGIQKGCQPGSLSTKSGGGKFVFEGMAQFPPATVRFTAVLEAIESAANANRLFLCEVPQDALTGAVSGSARLSSSLRQSALAQRLPFW